MPKGSFAIRSGPIDLHFLEPVPTAGFDYDHRAELMTEVWSSMAQVLEVMYGVRTSEQPVAKPA